MNNKTIRKNLLTTWLVGVTLCFTSSVALAGPLDRGDVQSRQNPAASSMIRVPGVLGQSERYALETLQRAGLNVKTKYIRQSMKKYVSRNGKVVKQIPSAGGLAMLGSSVSITIYKVDGEPIDESGDGGGGYGGSDYGSGSGGSYGGSGYGGGGSGGGYGGSGYGGSGSGDGYGGSGDGTGGSSGSGYGDPGGDGSGDADTGYGTDDAAPEDGSSGPDWGSSGSDSGGGSASPYTGP